MSSFTMSKSINLCFGQNG